MPAVNEKSENKRCIIVVVLCNKDHHGNITSIDYHRFLPRHLSPFKSSLFLSFSALDTSHPSYLYIILYYVYSEVPFYHKLTL